MTRMKRNKTFGRMKQANLVTNIPASRIVNPALIEGDILYIWSVDRSLTNRISREMDIVVHMVQNKIQDMILSTMDNIIIARIEMATSSTRTSSGRDVGSVVSNFDHEEHTVIAAALITNRKSRSSELELFSEIRGLNPAEESIFPVI